jgi:hypothetical protein
LGAGVVVLIIIIVIIMIGAGAYVWSENQKDFDEIQQITCDQYNLSEEQCKQAIEEAKK